MAAQFEIRSPKRGSFTWVLTSQGRVLAMGESYTRKASCQKAIESFRKGAPSAKVADLTLAPPATAPGKAARTAGRTVAKAVITGGRAVEKAEKTTAKAAAKTAKGARKAATKAEKRAARATKPGTKKR